ncbi:MAG: pilin [Candidatus Gottesmanbacteria bacterium]
MNILAQIPTWTNLEKASDLPADAVADVATIGSLASLFSNIIQAVTALAGVVLFVMLVMGGFTFLFSGGDQKKLEKAKGTITNAIIGLAVLVGSYLILLVIQQVTGVENLTIFRIQMVP